MCGHKSSIEGTSHRRSTSGVKSFQINRSVCEAELLELSSVDGRESGSGNCILPLGTFVHTQSVCIDWFQHRVLAFGEVFSTFGQSYQESVHIIDSLCNERSIHSFLAISITLGFSLKPTVNLSVLFYYGTGDLSVSSQVFVLVLSED
ncbi:hypothetical protein LR48_Vigan462s002600 [Vigna angularis]|uniref:Uncharacterized protein n=1 Tax=Phaseolus angularis TaxID=3914 RepID=A0A0L9TB44_PHAAN|nr:hypothetical protein LR48_Vigan462s002600 [Vigna angularis]